MVVRKYKKTDWSRLCEIHDAARLDELRFSNLEDAFLSLEETFINEGLFDGQVYVSEIQGEVVGFIAFTPDEVTWLYVDPKCYRQGVGRTLLNKTLETNPAKIKTEVLDGNEPALNLYKSEGFAVLKKVEGQLFGNESFSASGYLLERVQT